jgi:DNA mismatch endonuclease (patch repair protein)
MSRVRSRGNKDTELALARLLRGNKISGWRKQFEVRIKKQGARDFKVRPDFVFRRVRLALFVDGCFWHGCPKHATKPKNNRAFWQRKLSANKTRDKVVNRTLRRTGWRVLRIWEHALRQATKRRATKNPHNEARLLNRIQRVLK